MSAPDTERLYHLLPAIYRLRDTEQGEPLRALLAVIEGELRRLEDDIGALYDNWFIETCAEWVVPYLGDLLGVSAPGDARHRAVSQRTRVANTIAHRRRKGLASTIGHVIYDTTGWHTRVVELFQQVAISQHTHYPRPGQGAMVDVRDGIALGQVGGPFDRLARRVDVRPIAESSRRQSPANVAVFVWRLPSYPIAVRPQPATLGGGRYHLHPLGKDVQLFNQPQPPADPGQPAAPQQLPGPLDPLALAADLADYQRHPEPRPRDSDYYGSNRALQITNVQPEKLIVADLSNWEKLNPNDFFQAHTGKHAAVDVRRGRLLLAADVAQADVRVAYHYGFGADIGGGPYDRRTSLATPDTNDWIASVTLGTPLVAAGSDSLAVFSDLQTALNAWVATGRPGIIQILDSEAYDLPAITLVGRRLVIQAADGVFPSLRVGATLKVSGADAVNLTLNGVRIDGSIYLDGPLHLDLRHASVPNGISSPSSTPGLRLTITHSIVGPLALPSTAAGLMVSDSIVDGGAGMAISGYDTAHDSVPGAPTKQPGPPTSLARTTIFGPLCVVELGMASETIFTGPLTVERPQAGSLRYCYVPPGSHTPPRYRCQPDLEIAAQVAEAEKQPEPLTSTRRAAISAAVVQWLIPRFSTLSFGEPGYGQLAATCPAQIALGGEDGTEMGAFHLLHQPQRLASLRAALDEYLPAGLDAGVFFVT